MQQLISQRFPLRILVLASLIAACRPSATPSQGDAPAAGSEASTSSRTITFRPERVYEVTGIWIRPGQGEALQRYFQQVFPIAAADYGVRPLFSLEPLSVYAGDFHPDMMFVNEWPSLESFQAFVQDERAHALFPQRDAASARLVVTQYRVPEETRIELSESDVIEFGAMWIRPGEEQAFRAYYERVVPMARANHMRPLVRLAPAFSYSGDFMPTAAGFNWWGTLANFQAFEAEATPHFAARDATLRRLEVVHAKVHFEMAEGS